MLALFADDASGDTLPMAGTVWSLFVAALTPIWRAFPQAVPNFRVEVVEMLAAEAKTVVIQTVMRGPMPADAPGIAKKGQVVFIPHCLLPALQDAEGKISRLDAYWDNTVLNSIQPSAV